MPSLAEFQRDFAASMSATSMADGAESTGLRVHRNTVIKALVDAVVANYPAVGVLMGTDWLGGVAHDYVLQNPPRCAVLAGYGESFPEFLGAMGVAQDWPYLAGVAELDRAWTQSLLAPDAPALAPHRLAGLHPAAFASLRLHLHPSARFGVHGNSAVTVWKANRPPAAPPVELLIDGRDEAFLMVRNDAGVQLLCLDDAGRTFVEALIAASPVSTAAEHALQVDPAGDLAAIWSMLLVQGAFADIESEGN